jgi:hypothetical protein
MELSGFLAFFPESGVYFGHFTNLVVFAFGFFLRSSGACALALTTPCLFCFGLCICQIGWVASEFLPNWPLSPSLSGGTDFYPGF